jgi:hypothetical protein
MGLIDLIEELRKVDEVTLLELLDIEADALIDAFPDKIKERFQYIHDYLKEQ